MKTARILRRSLISLFFALSLLLTTLQPARADFFDDTVWLLEQTQVFPTEQIQAFKDARSFVNCLVAADNDLHVIACVDSFKDTPAGKELVKQGGIPSWFWDLVDLYVDVRTSDFWGAVGHLGKAAICFIAQVITGGADVCGVVAELIEMGEALLDAATAVAEFLADLGGAVVDTINGIGCTLGLGGCDNSPPPPPEVLVYQWIYGPKILEGVQALKQVQDGAFPALMATLRANALHRPYAIYSVPTQTVNLMGTSVEIPPKMAFNEPAVRIAEELYSKTTDANWTTEIVQNTLPDLSEARKKYITPQNLKTQAYLALARYQSELNGANAAFAREHIVPLVPDYVTERCTTHFQQTLGFAHFDRWLLKHAKEAYDLKRPDSTPLWCSKLINSYAKDFAPQFRLYLQKHGCSSSGDKLTCTTLAAYRSCLALMGTVNSAAECMANPATVGPEAAQVIRQKMIERGSNQQLYPCATGGLQSALNTAATNLVCTRPVQQKSCEIINKELFGQLPQTLVTCRLQESKAYGQLRQAVEQARRQLFGKHPGVAYKVDEVDPLIVYVDSNQSIAALQADPLNQSFAFPPPSSQPGFSYKIVFSHHSSMDGTDTPQIGIRLDKPDPRDAIVQKSPRDQMIQHHDPRINPDPSQNLQQGLATNPAAGLTTAPQAQVAAPFNQQFSGMQGQQTQQQVMSASLPAGSQPPAKVAPPAGQIAPRLPAVQPPAVVSGKPDLVAAAMVTVAGVPTQWGGSVVLSAQQLQSAGNGLCSVTITYTVQNVGSAASPAFASMLLNSALATRPLPQQWPELPQGASQNRTEQLLLRPGQNSLTLYLDQSGQVDELSKANNQTRLQIQLTGSCQPQNLQPQRQLPQRPLPTPVR